MSKAHTFDRYFEEEYGWLVEGLEAQPCPIPEREARLLAPSIRWAQEEFEKSHPAAQRPEFVRWLTGRLRVAWKDSPPKVVEEQIGLILGPWWSDLIAVWMAARSGRPKDSRDSKPRPRAPATIKVLKCYDAYKAMLRKRDPSITESDLRRWATEQTADTLKLKPREVSKILKRRP